MSKFTPGPWSWVERRVWSIPRDFDICILTKPVKRADAKLISKAPEMYDILIDYVTAPPMELEHIHMWRKNYVKRVTKLLKAINED